MELILHKLHFIQTMTNYVLYTLCNCKFEYWVYKRLIKHMQFPIQRGETWFYLICILNYTSHIR